MIWGWPGWTEFSGCRCVTPSGCMIVIFLLCLLLVLHASGSLSKGGRLLCFTFSGRAMGSGAYVPLFVDGHFFFRWLWFVINRSRCMGDEGMLEESSCWNTPFWSWSWARSSVVVGHIPTLFHRMDTAFSFVTIRSLLAYIRFRFLP